MEGISCAWKDWDDSDLCYKVTWCDVHRLSFGMLCRRKSVLVHDSGRCLATVKMHSPEGFGLCVYVCVCVCYLGTGSSSSGATHLCRLRGYSLIASAAPRGSRHWRCASS
jgi:hypothetical protein